jgi:hypothetical protein
VVQIAGADAAVARALLRVDVRDHVACFQALLAAALSSAGSLAGSVPDGYVLLVTVRVLLAFAAALADSLDEVDDQDSEDGVVSCVQPVLARCHGRHFLP